MTVKELWGRSSKWAKGFSLLALASVFHFAFQLSRMEFTDLEGWNRIACVIKDRPYLVSQDCLFSREKYFLFASAYRNRENILGCVPPRADLPETVSSDVHEKQEEVACQVWGSPKKVPDIGWDAYRIWYGRAFLLYRDVRLKGESLWKAFTNSERETEFNSWYYRKYPWGVSYLYATVMIALHNPNPMWLELLQVGAWLGLIFLFRLSWRRAPFSLWLTVAFIPIAGRFLLNLYGDIYLQVFFLLGFVAAERKKMGWAAFAWCVLPWIKSEGWVHAGAALWLSGSLFWREWRKRDFLILGAVLFSIVSYLGWSSRFPLPREFYKVSERLLDPQTYSYRLPLILKYYADVFFRPMLWGLWWPFVLGVFVWRGRLSWWRWLPLFGIFALIPLAFLTFPDGGHREVVLTGSNRALWQCLPLAWLLVRDTLENTREDFGTMGNT